MIALRGKSTKNRFIPPASRVSWAPAPRARGRVRAIRLAEPNGPKPNGRGRPMPAERLANQRRGQLASASRPRLRNRDAVLASPASVKYRALVLLPAAASRNPTIQRA